MAKKAPVVAVSPLEAVVKRIQEYQKPNAKNARRLLEALDVEGYDGLESALDLLEVYEDLEREDFADAEEYRTARQDAWDEFVAVLAEIEPLPDEEETPLESSFAHEDETEAIEPFTTESSEHAARFSDQVVDAPLEEMSKATERTILYTVAPEGFAWDGAETGAVIGTTGNGRQRQYRQVRVPVHDAKRFQDACGREMHSTHTEAEWHELVQQPFFQAKFTPVDEYAVTYEALKTSPLAAAGERVAPVVASTILQAAEQADTHAALTTEGLEPGTIDDIPATGQAWHSLAIAAAVPEPVQRALAYLATLQTTADALLAEIRSVTAIMQAAYPSRPSLVPSAPARLRPTTAPNASATKALDPNRKRMWTQAEIADVQARVARGETKVAIGEVYHCHHVIISAVNAGKMKVTA